MSRVLRAMDKISDDYHSDAVPEVISLVGGDLHSMDYVAASRAKRAVTLLAPGMAHNTTLMQRMAAVWMDGWTAGALFAAETAWPNHNDENQGDQTHDQ